MPLVAVLRGITPDEAVAVSDVLVESGFTIMEVTLNSPSPYESIQLMNKRHGDKISLGAGTVLKSTEVKMVKGRWWGFNYLTQSKSRCNH